MEKVQTKFVNISDLKLLKGNPRQISKENFEKLCNSIKENPDYFWARPILVNDISGENIVYAGNQRLRAAKKIGLKEVPCIIEKLSEEKEKERTIRDNVEFGEWDFDILANEWDVEKLEEWGVEIPNIDILPEDGLTDPDEVPEKPEKPKTKNGDLYELGEHRLLCGDSTILSDAEKLMDAKKAEMVFTDPPYNMNLSCSMHGDGSKTKKDKILNDKMKKDEFDKFLDDVFCNLKLFCKGAFYITFYRLEMGTLFNSLERSSLKYRNLIIWKKNNFNLSNSDYKSIYEPIFYGWNDRHSFHGEKNNIDVWEIDKTKHNDLHPTMKPVELITRAIKNSSRRNEIVLDLFGGSGSTMIACENLKRHARLMELDKKYCDVIVKRWLDFTGETEFKLNGQKITKEKWESLK